MKAALLPLTIISLLSLSVINSAYAEEALDSVPNAAMPGLIKRQVMPKNILPTQFKATPPAPAPEVQPVEVQGDIGTSFVLKQVVIVGSQVPEPTSVAALIQAEQGKKVNLLALKALAQQIEDAYRNDGWILNQVIIPQQEFSAKQGIVKFQVIDGYISQVKLTGDNPAAAQAQLWRYLKTLQSLRPFNLKVAQKYLVLANQIPGISVKNALSPDPTKVGGSVLTILVKRTPVQGSISFNNRGSQFVGPRQLVGQLSVNDIFAADTFNIVASTTQPKASEMGFFTGKYSVQLGQNGTQLGFSASRTAIHPGEYLETLAYSGYTRSYAVDLMRPLYRTFNQSVSFISNLYNTLSDSDFAGIPNYQDRVVGLQAGINYQGIGMGGVNSMQVTMTQGLPFYHKTIDAPSRTNAVAQFSKFNLDSSHIQYLTQRISYIAAISGQYTEQLLPSSEQISYGGTTYGQAYQPSELAGDKGLMGALTLRYDLPTYGSFTMIQPYVSYDLGEVWNNQAVVGSNTTSSASSLALGVNFALKQNLQATLTVAKPLTWQPSQTDTKDWQAFFSVSAYF